MGRRVLLIVGLAVVLLVLFFSLDAYADRKAEKTLSGLVSKFGMEGKVSYSEVDHSLLKGKTQVRDISLETEEGEITVRRIVIEKLGEGEIRVKFLGLTSTDPEFRKLERSLRELGYEDVEANLTIDVAFEKEREELKVRELTFEIPGAFRLSQSFHLDRFSPDLLEPYVRSQLGEGEVDLEEVGKLMKVRIRSFEFSLEDLGIRERMIEKEAKKKGKDPKKVKEEIMEEIDEMLREAESKTEKEIIAEIGAFIKECGTLKLTAKPEKPVSFGDLIPILLVSSRTADISQLADLLNLRVEHER